MTSQFTQSWMDIVKFSLNNIENANGKDKITHMILLYTYLNGNLERIFSLSGDKGSFIIATLYKIIEIKKELPEQPDEDKSQHESLKEIMNEYIQHYNKLKDAVIITLNEQLPPDVSRHIAETYI